MSRRTIQEAKELYEEALPGLSDFRANEIKQAIAANEQAATLRAEEFVSGRADELSAQRKEALQALTEARDGYEELAREVKTGRLSAADAGAKLDSFAEQQLKAEEALKHLQTSAEELAAIEEDPVAWADAQAKRLPNMLPDWDF